MKPDPREVLARAFAENQFDFIDPIGNRQLADVALKALKDAGFGLWRQMDREDEAIENQW